MRKFFSIAAAYIVAVTTVLPLYYVVQYVSPMPVPRGFLPWSVIAALCVLWSTAFFAAIPGFTVTRFVMWWANVRSAYAFAFAGAFTGVSAVVFASYPWPFSILVDEGIVTGGAFIGGVSGLFYCYAERMLCHWELRAKPKSKQAEGQGTK